MIVGASRQCSAYRRFNFYDLNCKFLEKSIRIIFSMLVATECEAESNDCVCIISAWFTSVDGDGICEETSKFSFWRPRLSIRIIVSILF